MFATLKRSKLAYILVIYFLCMLAWWIQILLSGSKTAPENNDYGFAYSFIALIGGINGLFVSKKWGGFQSLIGRGLLFITFGLLCEWFGQFVWSIYTIFLHVEVPYPSIADVGYVLMIPFYSYGIWCMARVAGAKLSLAQFKGKISVILIPLIMLTITYILILRGMQPDTTILKTILNFYSPLGESITISGAILAYLLSRNVLGGRMKGRMRYLMFALFFEFLTGMTFIYQANTNTYYNGGINDLMWTASFTIMSLGLLSFIDYE